MYLKSIEVYGFKSFANKIVFKFQEGITGIVGPNGSGKSNIADAVRWVLGEQSAKQLRSSKMEDVIFAGTETRRPMSYAYVMLTLDNSDRALDIDYEEVIVGRRVYRSGESEYLLNGAVCRLKDVTDLFTDTGIGKEGYSIIGQGQIDKVLSSKPEERRELFDEAAGIGKYKKRKNTTVKNLEEERKNLIRITDILLEIEKQLGPLERQSKDAKQYLGIYEELKKLEVNLFIIEYDKVRSSKEEVASKAKLAENSLTEARIKHSKTIEEYNRLDLLLENYDTDIENDKDLLNENKINIEKNEGDIKLIQEQIKGLKNQIKENQSRIDGLDEDIVSKTNEKNNYIDENKKIDKEIELIDSQQINFVRQIEDIKESILKHIKTIENHNSNIIDSLNKTSHYKTNLERYETLLEHNLNQKSEIDKKILQYNLDIEEIKDDLANSNDKLSMLSRNINDYNKEITDLEDFITSLQYEVNKITIDINKKQQVYHNEKSRLTSLINMTERYEGYGNSIRKVMDLKDKVPGIHGVVADLIKVDKKYETAIETAIGGSIQNIVTDNEETAKKLINYLKQNRYGRATFLPLTTIRGTTYNNTAKILNEEGVIGYADTLVEIPQEYKHLTSYLLGRNIVVDNIDNAIDLSRKYNQRLRIVTLDGELLNPGGSMSGGAYRNTSNLLGRRREISELEKSVKGLNAELASLLKEKEENKKRQSDYRLSLETAKSTLQNLSLKQNTLEINIEQLLSKELNIKNEFEEYNKTIKEIDNKDIDLHDKIRKTKEVLERNESLRKEYEEKINNTNILLSNKQEEEEKLQEEQSSIRVKYSTILQKKDNLIDNIKRVKKENERFYIDKSKLEMTIENLSSQIHLRDKELEERSSNIVSIQANIAGLEDGISSKLKLKEKEVFNHKNLLNKREDLSNEINELDKELLRLNNQEEKYDNQIEELKRHIYETYELTYASALGLRDATIIDLAETKKQVAGLKSKMKGLGTINLDAIVDYKEASQRYEFLNKQKNDLEESEKNLVEIIEELEKGMRHQFTEKFEAIRLEFNKVFKELFGGGRASLSLVSGQDTLDAGIIITAEPPGKKLQNMMQLSGGEKALTAISLLFAIQNLKPSPFCLLDEIESALDDSNVMRFAGYLEKLSKNTQFITITHRKGTMNAADTLYGITMQEKGISTLVAVNLIESELED